MNNVTIFESESFGKVRATEIDGTPYFVANDIAGILGYKNPQKAIRDHCKGVNETLVPSPGGEQSAKVIPESDIYRLIIRSKLPAAVEFEKWVCEEILPSVRKHGAYLTAERIEQVLSDPDILIQLATTLKEERAKRLKAEAETLYKSEVIAGLLPEISIYQKREIINRVVRHKGADFRARWAELYRVFTATYHVDLKGRCEGHNLKQKSSKRLSVVAYAEQFGHVDNLYNIAVKLYETDINEIVDNLKRIS